MPVSDLYLKLKLQYLPDEKPQKIADEICRQVLKMYGVRAAEVSNVVTEREAD